MKMLAVLGDLLIKYVAVTAVLSVTLLWIGKQPMSGVLVTAFFVTIIAYGLGDIGVYRSYGNTAATMGDFVIATLSVWLFAPMASAMALPFWEAIVSGAGIAVVEIFYHMYLGQRGYRHPRARAGA